jgi:hypothetical protein
MKAAVWDDCCGRASHAGEATNTRMLAKYSRTLILRDSRKTKPDFTLERPFTKSGDHTSVRFLFAFWRVSE